MTGTRLTLPSESGPAHPLMMWARPGAIKGDSDPAGREFVTASATGERVLRRREPALENAACEAGAAFAPPGPPPP